MAAYYNEIDPYAAQWLRNLINAGHIAPGDVDERSIEDVVPSDLRGYRQCHFFAGIGVWSYALRLAGWPDDHPVWTGSCPCQPFSAAGKRGGLADERHLWPAWHHLIRVCNPDVIFGEQVEAAIKHGWLDLVQSDLEGIGYAFAPVGIPAAGVGAPHIRHRLFWVADTNHTGSQGHWRPERIDEAQGRQVQERYGAESGFWGGSDWVQCLDGELRPIESGTFPLAHGAPARVGRLRAYGNAIVPQVAAEVIKAYMDLGRKG
jgi:DNA (cytosine-5)-methyltransferase 1